ncbi:MAG: hypothetical protein FJ128_05505 [Deltaproteobacteria bacterium]|nr:hypothetical protein [Deltaproteobacteria bacterium]
MRQPGGSGRNHGRSTSAPGPGPPGPGRDTAAPHPGAPAAWPGEGPPGPGPGRRGRYSGISPGPRRLRSGSRCASALAIPEWSS